MRAAALLLALALALGQPARAADPAAPEAQAAAAELREAVAALSAAEGSRERVSALTRTIRAYERGFGALRDALRRATAREAEIEASFAARRERIGALLGAMAMMERGAEPLLLLHPDGPIGTARSGMILASVTPALQAEAETLRAELDELRRVRELQAEVAETLQRGLDAAQAARTALAQAIQDRTDLPRRFLDDPEELKALVASADSLDSFAAGLFRMETDIGAPMGDFAGAKGTLPLPVQGTLLRRAGEADAAGIRRPGLLIATRPGALVTLPWPATVRYRGPLLDYGNVMIAEPASGYLLVLAGLASVFGETGDVLDAGAPVGLMGGIAPEGAILAGGEKQFRKYFYIESYGCAMNFADTEVVASVLMDNGFGATPDAESADLIFINTCSIREKAEQTVRNRLTQFKSIKKHKPGLIVGVLGCMAERLKNQFLEEEKLVDIVVGPDAYRTLPGLIEEAEGGQKAVNVLLSRDETYADISPVRLNSNGVTAFVSIMRGCNNMCSFCVVPFTRGRERSRDAASIVRECKTLFEQGYREVTLLGQNVDSYYWVDEKTGQRVTFAMLMEQVALLSPLLRVRFSTSHPKDITDEVLHTMAKYDNICNYIHLPVQSGSTRVLQMMNRTYSREWYIAKVDRIRELLPDCGFGMGAIGVGPNGVAASI